MVEMDGTKAMAMEDTALTRWQWEMDGAMAIDGKEAITAG